MFGHRSLRRAFSTHLWGISAAAGLSAALLVSPGAKARDFEIAKTDMQIDALDPGINSSSARRWRREHSLQRPEVVLFLHGATSPSTCDFDLGYRDYSWADWLVKPGYVVYMGDYRNYGGSTREPVMDEPASKNQPVTRSYLALRDIEAMVTHQGEAPCPAGHSDRLVMGRDDGRVTIRHSTLRTSASSCSMRRSTTSTTTPISGPAGPAEQAQTV